MFPPQLRELAHENVVTNCPACGAVVRPFTVVPGWQELALTLVCPPKQAPGLPPIGGCTKTEAAASHWREMQARLATDQQKQKVA